MDCHNFQPYITKKNEPPELSNNIEEINKIVEETHLRLKIIEHGQMEEHGTTVECSVLLECPYCNSQFTGHHSEGCFHSTTYPMICPVCKFPNNILGKLYEITQRKKAWEFEATFSKEVRE